MSKDPNWNAVRDRALQIERTGIKYDTAWQMAEREILHSPSGGRSVQISNETAANRAALLAKKQAAKTEFNRLVAEAVAGGLAYDLAHNRVARQHVELWNEAFPPKSAESDQDALGGSAAASNICPSCSPRHAACFGLSTSTDQPTFEAAWKSNGGTMSPVDHEKVLQGLVSYIISRDGVSQAAAQTSARAQNPILSQLLDMINS